MKIMIVEDDLILARELQLLCVKWNFQAKYLEDFKHVDQVYCTYQPDLILLDINLPFADGEYICKEIRKTSNVPIIMLTSRDSEIDELLSLNYGADQYVVKPFNIQILLAKINALLKRSQNTDSSQNIIDCKEFILNISKSQIEKDDQKIELTKNELKILHYLVSKRGQIVSREEIIDYLWDSQSFIDDNTLTVNIKRLRDKLEDLNLHDMIETKRGQGYILK